MNSRIDHPRVFSLHKADTPLLISVPHAGTRVPDEVRENLSAAGAALPDTDWFVDRLYAFAPGLGAGFLNAHYSRYVIDLNRPPDDADLYSVSTPGLTPAVSFNGESIYLGKGPGPAEVTGRLENFWRPYHEALEGELSRIRDEFGCAILLEAHSIRSRVPGIFEGQLPDLNLGSFNRQSADESLICAVESLMKRQGYYSHVSDGRFKGGYITRHYGRPGEGLHALQLEMAQSVYMDEENREWNAAGAARIRTFLHSLAETLIEWGLSHG